MKKTLPILVCAALLALCVCALADNPCVPTSVRLSGSGSNTNSYKVAFKPAENTAGLTAYLVGYSAADFAEVEKSLAALSKEELFALDKPVNRAYVIADLSYADGVGNTLNTNQKDLVTGLPFSAPGTYTFYAAAIGEDGLLGLAKADKTVTRAPVADSLTFTQHGACVKGSFRTFDGVLHQAVFWSYAGYEEILSKYGKRTFSQFLRFEAQGKAAICDQTEFELDLNTLSDINGAAYGASRFAYLYVVSFGESELLGIRYAADSFILPSDTPVSSGVIGDGQGTVFPNGGAAAIDGTRASIISKSQAIFRNLESPARIAVIGAASGNESEICGYFYLDDASVKSYEKRLKAAGFEAVYIPLTTENYKTVGESEYFAALVSSCQGVYLTGGNQGDAVRATHRDDGSLNLIGAAIEDVFERGGVLMGTSAGAHLLGNPCFQDGDSAALVAGGKTDVLSLSDFPDGDVAASGAAAYYPSFDCIRAAAGVNVVFDSHFCARGRIGRLLVMTHRTGTRYGIGLDEATGFAVKDGSGMVYGRGNVVILDMKEARVDDGARFSVSKARVYLLSAGDQFDFRSNAVIPASQKRETTERDSAISASDRDFFESNYAAAQTILSFALSGEKETKTTAKTDAGECEIVLSRTEETQVFMADKMYADIDALSSYPQSAVSGLEIALNWPKR